MRSARMMMSSASAPSSSSVDRTAAQTTPASAQIVVAHIVMNT